MALGLTEPLTEMSARNISWGVKAAGAWGWQPCYLHVPLVLKSGGLNLLEPSEPVQASIGIALPFQFQTGLVSVQSRNTAAVFGTEFLARVELCKFCRHKFAESLYARVLYIQNSRTSQCWLLLTARQLNVCVPTAGTSKCDEKNYRKISTVVSSLISLIYPVVSSEYPKPHKPRLDSVFWS